MRYQLSALLILALGCSNGDEARAPDSIPAARTPDSASSASAPVALPESARAWSVPPTRNYLSCSPQSVTPDSVIVLRMQTPHGSSLHIGGPDGTPYLVVFHGQGNPDRGARRSLMSPAAFAGLTELRLAVRSLTGGVWVFGRDTNEVVFRAPGTYRIRVGNDMETDGPDYAECVVTYEPAR